MIKIECVWCNTKTEFNRFIRLNDDRSYVINYLEVHNKIMKADPHGRPPTNRMIGLHIHNQIKMYSSKLEKFENHPQTIIYLIKNLNKDTAIGLKKTLESLIEGHEILMNLTIINRDDLPRKGVLSLFESVKFIDK